MKLKKKSKAFTLTELLVVVVVIGVLSAVVLPKFSKVIETRKTTEAEELMGAIRTEQEKRCALDKKYITDDISKLSDIVKNPETKNYTLTLASTGIKATRKDATYNYTLEMPSYADGRICCEDEACARLNKNYPSCTELKKKTDYQASPESCAGDEIVETPSIKCVGAFSESCGCQKKGIRYRACDSRTGTWTAWGPCSVSDECECTGTPVTEQSCTTSNTCGRETRSADCNTETGKWEYGTWDKSGCAAKPADEVGECPERTRSAVCTDNAWTWGAWTGECADKDCCDNDFTGDFAECITKKYGYDSAEWVCTHKDGKECATKLGIGSAPYYPAGFYDGGDSSWRQYWQGGQFKRYPCIKPPQNDSSDSDNEKGTCTISYVRSGTCYNRAQSCDGFDFQASAGPCKNASPDVWNNRWSGVIECKDSACTKEKRAICASATKCFGGTSTQRWENNLTECPNVTYDVYECK